jgi:2,5-diamino-6-(ribosylamino)-4(3H)-pyrimidinone 5'-phosphate reductase
VQHTSSAKNASIRLIYHSKRGIQTDCKLLNHFWLSLQVWHLRVGLLNMPQSNPRETLFFQQEHREGIEPYMPNGEASGRPFVTLTFATSLDSAISLAPGTQTALSGPQSKAMTHYLRSCHDAILVGVGTAIADDPSLNCRLDGAGGYGGEELEKQPVPVVIDPSARWDVGKAKCLHLAAKGQGRAPWIVTARHPNSARKDVLEAAGGKYILLATSDTGFDWKAVLEALAERSVNSVMIEGGGSVINSLLSAQNRSLVDSVIVTIAPTWLGQGGVVVSPPRSQRDGKAVPAARLKESKWQSLGEDVILCGRLM